MCMFRKLHIRRTLQGGLSFRGDKMEQAGINEIIRSELDKLRVSLKQEILQELEARTQQVPQLGGIGFMPPAPMQAQSDSFPNRPFDPWGWKFDAESGVLQISNAFMYSNRTARVVAVSGLTNITVATGARIYVYGEYSHRTHALQVKWSVYDDAWISDIAQALQRFPAYVFYRAADNDFRVEFDYIHGGAVTAELGV